MFDNSDVGKLVRCKDDFAPNLTFGKSYEILSCDVLNKAIVVMNDYDQKLWYDMSSFAPVAKKEQTSHPENILQQILSITEEHPEIEVIVSQGKFSVDYCSDSHHRIIKVGSLQDTLECVKLMKQWLEVEVALKELEEK